MKRKLLALMPPSQMEAFSCRIPEPKWQCTLEVVRNTSSRTQHQTMNTDNFPPHHPCAFWRLSPHHCALLHSISLCTDNDAFRSADGDRKWCNVFTIPSCVRSPSDVHLDWMFFLSRVVSTHTFDLARRQHRSANLSNMETWCAYCWFAQIAWMWFTLSVECYMDTAICYCFCP